MWAYGGQGGAASIGNPRAHVCVCVSVLAHSQKSMSDIFFFFLSHPILLSVCHLSPSLPHTCMHARTHRSDTPREVASRLSGGASAGQPRPLEKGLVRLSVKS